MAKLNKTQTALLVAIANATLSEIGFLHVSEKDAKGLVALGLVEQNPELLDADGNIATRATPAGIEASGANQEQGELQVEEPAENPPETAPVAAQAMPTGKPAFDIESNIARPERKRSGNGRNLYPFDVLEVNQSFFIPPTEKHPEPWKSLQSTVSSASARYAVAVEGQTKLNRKGVEVPVMKHTRKFSIYEDVKDGVRGARVFRDL